MSTFFAFQAAVIDWLARQGVDRRVAQDYVTSHGAGLAAEAVTAADDALPTLVAEHETPGGLNQQLRHSLQDAGVFDSVTLDRLADRLRRG
jgi:pyrroline-5-carboxylate reductase